jgi:5-(carboxyamino)imidazole ribonucleotide mutase
MDEKPKVGVVMGSQSDWDVMQHAARVLKDFGVPFQTGVLSAHRTPDAMFEYAEQARGRGSPASSRARAARRTCPA